MNCINLTVCILDIGGLMQFMKTWYGVPVLQWKSIALESKQRAWGWFPGNTHFGKM